MKISVHRKPIQGAEDDFYNNYEINAEFDAPEESTAQDLSNMLFDAMLLEGYLPQAIIKAMVITADDRASWFDIDFNDILIDTGCIEAEEIEWEDEDTNSDE